MSDATKGKAGQRLVAKAIGAAVKVIILALIAEATGLPFWKVGPALFLLGVCQQYLACFAGVVVLIARGETQKAAELLATTLLCPPWAPKPTS